MQDHVNAEQLACIRSLMSCYDAAMARSLCPSGAVYSDARQTLIIACTEICRVSAHFLGLGVVRPDLCGQCAETCESCAAECERAGDMDDLVAVCRECAEHCRRLAA